jgi:hypothetical protein
MDVFMGMITMDTLTITPRILSRISEIDEFKGAWRAPAQSSQIDGKSIRQAHITDFPQRG